MLYASNVLYGFQLQSNLRTARPRYILLTSGYWRSEQRKFIFINVLKLSLWGMFAWCFRSFDPLLWLCECCTELSEHNATQNAISVGHKAWIFAGWFVQFIVAADKFRVPLYKFIRANVHRFYLEHNCALWRGVTLPTLARDRQTLRLPRELWKLGWVISRQGALPLLRLA